jgi:pyridoxine 5-phosphate synthase
MRLGVNIDHIAVLREARQVNDPDILDALSIVKRAGGDQVTIHLREDRRHIHDDDTIAIIKHSVLPVNVECALDPSIIEMLTLLRPMRITLVPEKRQEVTTEGGLDLKGQYDKIKEAIQKFHDNDIEVALFIEPSKEAVDFSHSLGANGVELHTGAFANIYGMLHSNLSQTRYKVEALDLPRKELHHRLENSIDAIKTSAAHAKNVGLMVAAGHGINYHNVSLITPITDISELNIGQSIIARSVFTGLENAIIHMKELLR